ncbi:MAG: hypothetical protein WHS43_00700 [Aquificaceae bacterium]|jgi:hypothetical protein|uniref:hypothetical protein n=1 Tax=Hydrogenobacter sp. Uz 6-8 TaxID=3384828 RepID=UPI000F1B06D9|nr:MAG: hypothetical protein D6804_05360 [Aquificota bacterium]
MKVSEIFRIRGKTVEISYEDIIRSAQKEYEIYKGTDYFALVEGRLVPAKRLVEDVLTSKGTGLTLQDITTKYAVDILRKFDIPVMRKSDVLRMLAGSLSIGGDAVEEEKKLYSS